MNLEWRKSSRSTNQGGACVEVAALPGAIAIRDSKNPDAYLTLKPGQFAALIQTARTATFTLRRQQ